MKTRYYLFLFSVVLSMLFGACNWFRYKPEVADVLATHFKNKLYKQFDTAVYNPVFESTFRRLAQQVKNPKLLREWYRTQGDEPILVTRFFKDGQLDSLQSFINRADAHGLNPEAYGSLALSAALEKLKGNRFKTIDEVYPAVAELEIVAADAWLSWHNAMVYGSINPKNFLTRYTIKNERPDSSAVFAALDTKGLYQQLLKDQPADPGYKALQEQLRRPENIELKPLIAVNMERLRWKQPDMGNNYVFVNIPDFSLTWFKGTDTVMYMRVCVGARREAGFKEKIQTWLKTRKLDDKPTNHETPMIVSRLNAIQANPVWNIPVSIAQSEIYYQALKDPYYLSNNNISVYYKDKKVGDPDTIRWNRYPREKLPFRFKQGSGEGNALGKFKFIFDSSSSIYLHDTNNKGGFSLKNRAISHGCIRIEKPLEFAEHLLNDKYAYDRLRMEVNLPPIDTTKISRFKKMQAKRSDTLDRFRLEPSWFSIKPDVPLIITYFTAWVQNGKLERRNDIYGQDEILLKAMKKYALIR